MAWQIPQSVTQAATVANLTTTDDVFVASGVTIASTAAATIEGTGSDHEALIYGTVVGNIILGDNSTLDSGETVTIKAGGHVQSFGIGSAIVCFGVISQITNEGLIASTAFGIALEGISVGTTTSTITNSGTIDVTFSAIDRVSGNETTELNNSGLIHGGTRAYFALGALGSDLITNTGMMIGLISLGADNDVYNGAQGRLTGDVFGGEGNDVITGGKDNDVFFGDNDNDILTGGLGRDTFTGGLGRDFFDFNSVKESVKGANRDVILDFNRAVDDRIDLRTIDADSSANPGNDVFKFIGNAAFKGGGGELRSSGGIIQGDVNGDKVADFEIKVNIATMVAGDFFL
jgi:Ca2+-binding RTX toxin-like protein